MPEDVKAAALKVRQGLCLDCECTYERGCGCLSAISTAILAERERCAKIAERFDRSFPAPANDGCGTRVVMPVEGRDIARAILGER